MVAGRYLRVALRHLKIVMMQHCLCCIIFLVFGQLFSFQLITFHLFCRAVLSALLLDIVKVEICESHVNTCGLPVSCKSS